MIKANKTCHNFSNFELSKFFDLDNREGLDFGATYDQLSDIGSEYGDNDYRFWIVEKHYVEEVAGHHWFVKYLDSNDPDDVLAKPYLDIYQKEIDG